MAACLTFLILSGCTAPQVVHNPDGTTSTNAIVHPNLTTALTTAEAVNTATAPVNPWSPVVSIVLAAAASVATFVAKRKNDQANESALIAKTIIQGVENSGHPETKAAIKTQATAIGIEGKLGTLVQAVNSGVV